MTAALFGIREANARAFGRRMYRILEDLDEASWRDVLPALSAIRARPFLGYDGRFSLPSQPLCDFEYHRPPTHDHPILNPDVVPKGDLQDVEWLLTHVLLQTCHTRVQLQTEHLAYVWHDELGRTDLAKAAPGDSQFAQLSSALFQHSGTPPEEIWFLQAASHLQSYVPPDLVKELADHEDRVGLLGQLASLYEGSDLARDLRRLGHFLGLASANGEAAFLCYGAD